MAAVHHLPPPSTTPLPPPVAPTNGKKTVLDVAERMPHPQPIVSFSSVPISPGGASRSVLNAPETPLAPLERKGEGRVFRPATATSAAGGSPATDISLSSAPNSPGDDLRSRHASPLTPLAPIRPPLTQIAGVPISSALYAQLNASMIPGLTATPHEPNGLIPTARGLQAASSAHVRSFSSASTSPAVDPRVIPSPPKHHASASVTHFNERAASVLEFYVTDRIFDIGKYTGEVQRGRPEGLGTLVRAEGHPLYSEFVTYSGKFVEGCPHGQGEFTYAKGHLLLEKYSHYAGAVANGIPHGQGTAVNEVTLERYTGRWRRGQFHGLGTETDLQGQAYRGEWEFGKRKSNCCTIL